MQVDLGGQGQHQTGWQGHGMHWGASRGRMGVEHCCVCCRRCRRRAGWMRHAAAAGRAARQCCGWGGSAAQQLSQQRLHAITRRQSSHSFYNF